MRDVAVIGGGYAGMACAVELADRGTDVTVLEASRTLGGRARRVDVRGLALDNGLHLLLGAYRSTLEMIARVGGVAQGASFLRLPLDLNVPGHLRLRLPALPSALALPAALGLARGLGLGERLAIVRLLGYYRLRGFRLRADMSVNDLLRRHRQPPRLCTLLWHPLCVSALNTPPEEASARVFLAVLRDSLLGGRGDSDFLLARVDLSRLFPEPAQTYIEARGGSVRTGQLVTSLRPVPGGFALDAREELGRFRRVVCAVPPYAAARLLQGLPELAQSVRVLNAIHYQPIVSVYLQYAAHQRLSAPMLGFTGGIAQWAFDRSVLCQQPGLVGVVISAQGTHRDLEPEELCTRVAQELAAACPGLDRPLWTQVIAEKRATFSCTVGLERPRCALPFPGLMLAGDYTWGDYPATIESAVRSGRECALALLGNSTGVRP